MGKGAAEKARETRQNTSGKRPPGTSGKSSGKPEVETSGKNNLPLPPENLPLTADTDDDIQLGKDVASGIPKGWRMEKNSNGYWRLRYQLKDDDGDPVTYITKSGRKGYKRGSQYVPISEVERVKKETGYK